MIPTQEEAWQSIVDSFSDHTVELGDEAIYHYIHGKTRWEEEHGHE